MDKMLNFVRNNSDVELAIESVKQLGWPQHRWNNYKNWEMLWLGNYLEHGDCLDVGCVTSMALEIAVHLGNKCRKVGIDPVPEYAGWSIPDGCELLTGRAESLPFDNESFDVVTCLSVIEHGVNIDEFSKEAWRVLRPNGTLIVTFDFWPFPKNECALDFSELLKLFSNLSTLGFLIEATSGTVQEKVVSEIYTIGALRAFKPQIA